MPIGTGLPSLAMLLFNRPIRTLLPQVNRNPINYNADDENYKALKLQQDKYLKNIDTHRDSFSFPIGSTVALQRKDGGLRIHGVIVESNSTDLNGQPYKVRVTKTGRVMTHKTRHIQKMPIMTEQYLRQQIVKALGI